VEPYIYSPIHVLGLERDNLTLTVTNDVIRRGEHSCTARGGYPLRYDRWRCELGRPRKRWEALQHLFVQDEQVLVELNIRIHLGDVHDNDDFDRIDKYTVAYCSISWHTAAYRGIL
jgi:hypothetical protein